MATKEKKYHQGGQTPSFLQQMSICTPVLTQLRAQVPNGWWSARNGAITSLGARGFPHLDMPLLKRCRADGWTNIWREYPTERDSSDLRNGITGTGGKDQRKQTPFKTIQGNLARVVTFPGYSSLRQTVPFRSAFWGTGVSEPDPVLPAPSTPLPLPHALSPACPRVCPHPQSRGNH